MRVVLATVGTRGDVQPMLALAQALARRGHEPIVACPDSFAGWVRAHGVEHSALGEDLQARMARGGAKFARSLSGMTAYFTEQLALQAPRLLEIATGTQAIVGTAMAWMAPSVAHKLGIAALELFPSSCVPSRRHPPPLMPWYGLPQWINGLLWSVSEVAQNRLMGAPLNAALSRIGLPPIASFSQYLYVDTPCVIAADESVLPPDPAWQGRYPYAGFLFADEAAPLDPALERWLDEGEPPIYLGFGSMAGGPPERVGGWLPELVRATGRRYLVASGAAQLLAGVPPSERCFVVGAAPHQRLFPRVALAVHHGGSGTMAAALRAGVPQVILPMMLDQFHHAHHLVRAGLAPAAPKLAKVTPKTLAAAIDRALALPEAPRRPLAARLQHSDAGGVITDMLERLANRA